MNVTWSLVDLGKYILLALFEGNIGKKKKRGKTENYWKTEKGERKEEWGICSTIHFKYAWIQCILWLNQGKIWFYV